MTFRYESPVGASPSRNLDHQKPFEEEMFDRSTNYRGSVGRAIGNATSYNGKCDKRYFPSVGLRMFFWQWTKLLNDLYKILYKNQIINVNRS